MEETLLHKGELLEGNDLETEYRLRSNDYINDSISPGAQLPDGWEPLHVYKTKTNIRKRKKISDLLEDKVWRLFYDLGAKKLSSKHFSLVLKKRDEKDKTKQIDVLAIDDDVIFVVECKSRDTLGAKSLKKDIAEFAGNIGDIRDTIKKLLNKRDLTFVFILATENILLDDNDRGDAKDASIYIWDEYDIYRLQELTKLTGQGAKYQIYNLLFAGKKLKNFEIKVPALKSKMGGYTYYSFILSPEDLLKISYVHHRSRHSSFLDLADSYQRMINPQRIRKIEQFIEDGGFFPGNIILNFHHKPIKEEILGDKKHLSQIKDCVKPVILTLPNIYGSAWIIDGQHRLYGYSDLTEKKQKETVPVIAFIEEERGVEAKIFVDINKNQKSIEANLLWDLYEDLYAGTEDDKEKELFAISKIAKTLNSRKDSPFNGHIGIPKEQSKGNLTLQTICSCMRQQRLLSNNEDERLLYFQSYEETIKYASDRIIIFFEVLRDMMPEEWEGGDKHYIRTNSGYTVLLGIFKDILECNLTKPELADTNKFRNAINKFLEPLIIHLIDCDNEKIRDYRGAGGAGQKSRQIRLELTRVIRDAKIGFRSTWLEKYEAELLEEKQFEKNHKKFTDLLDDDENEFLEFKGSLTLNIDRYLRKDGDGKLIEDLKLLDDGVLKTIVAFLNTKGGEVIIGILEQNKYSNIPDGKLENYPIYKNKILFGIEKEYKKDGWDGYEQRIINFIESKISPELFYYEWVKIEKKSFEGIDLCQISVQAADSKQFLNKSKFFVRIHNKTVSLEGKEIDKFWTAKNCAK
jgi:DNA sulfur modification protein DndB